MRFAHAGSEQIRVYDLDEERCYVANVKEVGAERNYNNVELSVEDLLAASTDPDVTPELVREVLGSGPLSVEDWLCTIEGAAARIVDRLVSDPDEISTLTLEEQIDLARFVATLYLRGPGFHAWLEDLRSDLEKQVRTIARSALFAQLPRRKAQAMWDTWERQPIEQLVEGLGPSQPKMRVAQAFAGTPGWANPLLAMPWRVGRTLGRFSLFTADNGVGRYLTPARPRWDRGAFTSHDWYVPLAPDVLLKIERTWDLGVGKLGERRRHDFAEWETSLARHVMVVRSTRRVYGDCLLLDRATAREGLVRIERDQVQTFLVRPALDAVQHYVNDRPELGFWLPARARLDTLKRLEQELLAEFHARGL